MPLPMLHISVNMDDRQESYTEADSSSSQAGESTTLRGGHAAGPQLHRADGEHFQQSQPYCHPLKPTVEACDPTRCEPLARGGYLPGPVSMNSTGK